VSAEQPWYASRGVIWSGALLAVILLVGAGVALTGGSERRGAGAATVSAAAVDMSWGSRCGLPHGSQDPIVGPPRAQWTLVAGIPVPSIRGVGPGVVETGDRRCYQHSPLGALLSAANFLPTTGAATDERLATDHYTPGRMRDIYAKQPGIPVDPNTTVQTVGFKVGVIDRDAVNVTLAMRVNGTLAYAVLPMRWTDPGDWRVQPLGAAGPFEAGPLDSMADYIPWSA
jgi:hypothetical protein